MSLEYSISPPDHLVRITGCGMLSTKSLIDLIERVVEDPQCDPDDAALIDLRDATYEPEDQAEVLKIAQTLANFHQRLRGNIAIIARRAMLLPAEILALYVRRATGVGIKVFLNVAAAEAFCSGTPKTA